MAFESRVDHEVKRVSVLLCWTMVLRGRMLRSRRYYLWERIGPSNRNLLVGTRRMIVLVS